MGRGLPNLRKIILSADDISIMGLRIMVEYAKRLSHLHFYTLSSATNVITIHMTDYRLMLNAVQNQPEKINLNIGIRGRVVDIKVPNEILLANRHWLWINVFS